MFFLKLFKKNENKNFTKSIAVTFAPSLALFFNFFDLLSR